MGVDRRVYAKSFFDAKNPRLADENDSAFDAEMSRQAGSAESGKTGRMKYNSSEAKLWAVLPTPRSLFSRNFSGFGQGFSHEGDGFGILLSLGMQQ